MSKGVNKVILLGHLGRDPEVRYTGGGKAIANTSLATTESWKDSSGQYQDRTEWHQIAFFGKLAEIAQQYLRKGSQVYLEGRLNTQKWQSQDGQEKQRTQINCDKLVMLDKRSDSSEAPQSTQPSQTSAADYARATGGSFQPDYDEIPF